MTAASIQKKIREILATAPDSRWVVAYSGGLDSTVLLDVIRQAVPSRQLLAVHVNHHLQQSADDFERHCRQVCRNWGISLQIQHGEIAAHSGQSPEEAAREMRHQALQRYAEANTVILQAHHQDDQAETVLLQMLRGSGVAGSQGMLDERAFGAGRLMRPLLTYSRAQIEQYATEHQLPVIEDLSNRDTNFDRNFLRHEILPRLKQRWPAADRSLARAASHHAHAARLLGERASADGGDQQTLALADLLALSADRQRNLVRYWIMSRGYKAPPAVRLQELLRVAVEARSDRVPCVAFNECKVYRWRGALHLVPHEPELPAEMDRAWLPGTTLALPEVGMQLTWQDLQAQLHHSPGDQALQVRLRRGGEYCRPVGRQQHHSLKKLLQAAGVPPWCRNRIPLIYEGAGLRLVWNHFECTPQQQYGGYLVESPNNR